MIGLDDTPDHKNKHDPYHNFAGEENRVQTVPYILDTVGPIVGVRMHYPNVISYGKTVQSTFVDWHGVTLGTVTEGFSRKYGVDEDTLLRKLGVGIRWKNFLAKKKVKGDGHDGDGDDGDGDDGGLYMRTSILRGMVRVSDVYFYSDGIFIHHES